MSGRPWYAQYPDDYERKTSHLTMVQHGAYRLLLDQYYKTGRPLPADIPTLQRMCRASLTVEKQAISTVLAEFFTLEDDGWHNKRADEELAIAIKLSAERSASGRAGGIAARGKSGRKRIATEIANEIAEPIANELEKNTHLHSTSTSTPSSEPVGSSDGYAPQADAPPQTETPKAKSSRSKPKTQLPELFPDEKALEDARQFWSAHARFDLIERITEEADQFRDHHLKNATPSANWPASWRTWYRNTPQFIREKKPNGKPAKETRLDRLFKGIAGSPPCRDAEDAGPEPSDQQRDQSAPRGAVAILPPAGHERSAGGREIPDFLRRSRGVS